MYMVLEKNNNDLTKGSVTSYSSSGYNVYYQKITNNIYQIYISKILPSVGTTIDWILGGNFPLKPTSTQILPLFIHVTGNVVGIGYIYHFLAMELYIYHAQPMIHKYSLMFKD